MTANRQVRLLLRDLNGKSCWDASIIYREPKPSADEIESVDQYDGNNASSGYITGPHNNNKFGYGNKNLMMGSGLDSMISTIGLGMTQPPRHTLRHRPPNQLPLAKDLAPDLDQLDDVSFINFLPQKIKLIIILSFLVIAIHWL